MNDNSGEPKGYRYMDINQTAAVLKAFYFGSESVLSISKRTSGQAFIV